MLYLIFTYLQFFTFLSFIQAAFLHSYMQWGFFLIYILNCSCNSCSAHSHFCSLCIFSTLWPYLCKMEYKWVGIHRDNMRLSVSLCFCSLFFWTVSLIHSEKHTGLSWNINLNVKPHILFTFMHTFTLFSPSVGGMMHLCSSVRLQHQQSCISLHISLRWFVFTVSSDHYIQMQTSFKCLCIPWSV